MGEMIIFGHVACMLPAVATQGIICDDQWDASLLPVGIDQTEPLRRSRAGSSACVPNEREVNLTLLDTRLIIRW